MPRPPAPPHPERYLFSGRFDDPAWLIHGGWDTLGFLNLEVRESWSGYALDMSGPGPALLALPVKAANGLPNLPLDTGTLRCYFAPDWSSGGVGGGPGGEARLIEFGAWSAQGQETFCWLGVDGLGSTIRLVVNGATGPVEILAAPIQWAAGEWHQVALTWASGGPTVLYLDGSAVAAGVGLDLTALESRYIGTRTPGFCIGSDGQGTLLAQGQFEEVYTFSRACTSQELAWNWQVQSKIAALGPITETEQKALLDAVAQLKDMPRTETGGMSRLDLDPDRLSVEVWWSQPSELIVTLHKTIPGALYRLWSKEDLNVADWTPEHTVVGSADQNSTETTLQMGERSALFLMAEQIGFRGLTYEDTVTNPPDTMGAVGPNHFVELLNRKIAVYDNKGDLLEGPTDTVEFFRVDPDFPSGDRMYDPRILYDHQSNRWVACALDSRGSRDVSLAVSIGTEPRPLDNTNWRKYRIMFSTGTGDAADFPTLGLDANGIYVSAFYLGGRANRVVAIDKAKVYALPSDLTGIVWPFDIAASLPHLRVIQPPVNFDAQPPGNLVWLITKDGPAQDPYRGGALLCRRLEWIDEGDNKAVRWKPTDTDWRTVPELPGASYRDYFDLDEFDETENGVRAPHSCGNIRLGPPVPVDPTDELSSGGSRLSMAVIRNNVLWTCHHVGLDGVDGDYDGDASGASVNRSAIQWFSLHIDLQADGELKFGETTDWGRIWDEQTSQPHWYYYPSLMVNSTGAMVVGFSGSSETSHIGAYYSWRGAPGTPMQGPMLVKAGEDCFEDITWGDYSCTSLDPADGRTIWTVQQYARPQNLPQAIDAAWGTWIWIIRLD